MLDTAFRLGKTTTSKIDVLNAFGESVPVEVRVSPIEDKGRVKFFVILYSVKEGRPDLLQRGRPQDPAPYRESGSGLRAGD